MRTSANQFLRDAARRALAALALLACSAIHAAAQTCEAAPGSRCYYVSNKAGSGSGSFVDPYGMADLPRADTSLCALSSRAIEPLQPGDILYFRGGSYSFDSCAGDYWALGYIRPPRSGQAGKPITFKAYPAESVQVGVASGNQPVFGMASGGVNFNYVRVQGFTILKGFGQLIGNNHEVSYNEIIGSFVNTSFNHNGISVGIYQETTDAPWIHHNIIRGIRGLSENSAGLKLYSTTNGIIEDNYIEGNTAGVHDKHGNMNNTYRRNYISNNERAQLMGGSGPNVYWKAYFYDNVIDGDGVNSVYVSDGSEIHDNLIRGSTLAGTWQGDSWNFQIWNNIVISEASSITAYNDSQSLLVTGGTRPHFRYLNYNLYDASPFYRFGKYSGSPQNFTMQDMRGRGFEQNSAVSGASQIFIDEVSYALRDVWKTSGRFSDAYGPDDIGQILNIARYGPSARPGATSPTAGTAPPSRPRGLNLK